MKKEKERGFNGKRPLVLLLMCMTLIVMWTFMAFAAKITSFNGTGTIINIRTTLTVREKPASTGDVIGSLKNGAKVTITGKTDGWYRIKYDGGTGYISSAFVTVKESSASDSKKNHSGSESTKKDSQDTSEQVVSQNQSGLVNTGGPNLNVRKKPSKTAEVIGSASNGSNVSITGTSGEWYQIKYGSGKGYVIKTFVKAGKISSDTTKKNSSDTDNSKKDNSDKNSNSGSASSSFQSVNKYGTVKAIGSRLNVREKASTSAEVIGSLQAGEKIVLTGYNSDWYRIKFNGTTGYVSKLFVTAGKNISSTSVKEEKKEKTTTVSVKYNYGVVNVDSRLNVRALASASASVIGSLTSGTNVTVKNESNGFYKIVYGSGYGYVAKGYVDLGRKSTQSDNQDNKKQENNKTDSSEKDNSGSVRTYSKIVLNCVPYYRQDDSRWSTVAIGKSNLKERGCAVTCLAMCYEAVTGSVCTPPMMVKKLKFTDSGALYWPSDIAKYEGSSYLKKIYEQLDEGNPVIVNCRYASGGQHYVVVYGYNGSSSSLSGSGFMVYDPGTSSVATLQGFLNKAPEFIKMVYYK